MKVEHNVRGMTREAYPSRRTDRRVVEATILLVKKLLDPGHKLGPDKRTVSKILRVFEHFPKVARTVDRSIELIGPRRWFEGKEVFRWWDVRVEDYSLHVSSGGHLFKADCWCDTFVCFTWDAAPGVPSDYGNFLKELSGIPEVRPFSQEIESLDLSEPGFTLSTFDAAREKRCRAVKPKQLLMPQEQATIPRPPKRVLCELCGREIEEAGRANLRPAGVSNRALRRRTTRHVWLGAAAP